MERFMVRISAKRCVDISAITSVEKVGANVVVRWSNGDKEMIQGEVGENIFAVYAQASYVFDSKEMGVK